MRRRLITTALFLGLAFLLGIVFQKYVSIWTVRHFVAELFSSKTGEPESPEYQESPVPTSEPVGIDRPAIGRRMADLRDRLAAQLEDERVWRKSAKVDRLLTALERAHRNSKPSDWELTRERYYFHFVRPLFEPPADSEVRDAAGRMSEVSRWFGDHGIHFIFCPLPNKLDTEASLLLGRSEYLSLSPQRTEYLIALIEGGVDVIDLRYDFGDAAYSGHPLFYRYDHHWTSYGMEVAALKLAAHIDSSFNSPLSGERGRFGRRFATVREPHSYVSYLPPDTKFGTRVVEEVLFDEVPLLEDPNAPICLVGDSNLLLLSQSRDKVSGDFTSRLAAALGRPLHSEARPGDDGSIVLEVAQRLLDSSNKPAILVWLRHEAGVAPAVPDVEFEPIAATPDHSQGRLSVKGTIEFLSEIPDPATAPYPDALVTFSFRPTGAGDGEERLIHCVTWAFRDRKRVNRDWMQLGASLTLELRSWRTSQRADLALRTTKLIDHTLNFQAERYFVVDVQR